jgi:hypothetical protein
MTSKATTPKAKPLSASERKAQLAKAEAEMPAARGTIRRPEPFAPNTFQGESGTATPTRSPSPTTPPASCHP